MTAPRISDERLAEFAAEWGHVAQATNQERRDMVLDLIDARRQIATLLIAALTRPTAKAA